MPSGAECLCCQDVDRLHWKLQGLECIACSLSVCLNEEVLLTAVSMVDVRGDIITELPTSLGSAEIISVTFYN